MPGLQTYLDTPVVPTQAFVGAAYNNADCAYPDTTPAIKEVDGDAIGPWVSTPAPGNADHHRARQCAGGQQRIRGSLGQRGAVQSEEGLSAVTALARSPRWGTRATLPLYVWRFPRPASRWSDTLITGTVPDAGVPTAPSSNRRSTGEQPDTSGPASVTTRNTAAGHHGRQRQAVDRHGDGHHWRQSPDSRHRLAIDSEHDRRRLSGRLDHRRPDVHNGLDSLDRGVSGVQRSRAAPQPPQLRRQLRLLTMRC